MALIDRLEAKLGRFAIPGLVQILALLQALTLVLVLMSSREGGGAFLSFLELVPERVMQGEVWRLFTHIFIPRSFSILWAIIGTIFMFWIGRGLDEAWGAFKVNVYVIAGILALGIGALMIGYTGGGLFLFQTLLFAFAMFYPNEEILLFFVIPLKVKWIAILGAAMMGFAVLGNPTLIWPALFANLNFLIAFGPGILQASKLRAEVMERRSRFASANEPEESFFHQCHVCGKTEKDDPKLDFRVTDSGDEICDECRKTKVGN